MINKLTIHLNGANYEYVVGEDSVTRIGMEGIYFHVSYEGRKHTIWNQEQIAGSTTSAG